jgi:hypothetical protein
VPWPDFSELSFGFAFLREFEKSGSAGSFPLAPDFISQNEEAKKGYDVAVLNGSTPVFLQFKRSYVLTTARANEIQSGEFSTPPLFRMHLRKKNRYRQHIALQELEQDGHAVYYVTSQIVSFEDLTLAYTSNTILDDTAAVFSPNEIVLPNRSKPHHLCFEANGTFAYIYSDEGRQFRRKYPNYGTSFERNLQLPRRSASANRRVLAEVADRLSPASGPTREIADRFDDPVIKASVLAFLVLDAQLAFFKPK